MLKKLKKVDVPELNQAYNKILLWFFSFPDAAISLNELAEKTKVSKSTASSIVKKLVGERFLKKEELSGIGIWRISCNQSHIYNFSKKIGYNLFMVYNSGILQEIKKLVETPRVIILFGSYRKGDDTEKSDIDIAVEVLGNEDQKITELGILRQLGYREHVKVNIHIFSRSKTDINLFANIANGIVLEGFLEVKP